MSHSTEKEYWGLLTEDEFNKKLKEFTGLFGVPEKKIRLSIEINDWTRRLIDNRIKITNGKAEFVQKTGDWNTRERGELEFPLVNDVETIFDFYKALVIIIDAKEPTQTIMQHENYIFETDKVEIKLSLQTGKIDKYNFEVELKDDSQNLDKICDELGLKPDLDPKDRAFWDKWNEELNFNGLELSDDELKELIKKYLETSKF